MYSEEEVISNILNYAVRGSSKNIVYGELYGLRVFGALHNLPYFFSGLLGPGLT
jgi:hypothetical protein